MGKAGRGRWCAEHHVSARALRKAADIRAQLAGHLAALGLAPGGAALNPKTLCTPGDSADCLRRALVAGLFPHAAVALPDGETPHLPSHAQSYACWKGPCVAPHGGVVPLIG